MLLTKFVNQSASTTFFGEDLKESLQNNQPWFRVWNNLEAKGSYKKLSCAFWFCRFLLWFYFAFIPFSLLFARLSKDFSALFKKICIQKFYSYLVVPMFMSILWLLIFCLLLLAQVYIKFQLNIIQR
jgi:hypothetical protein